MSGEGEQHTNPIVDADNKKSADIPYPTPNNLLGRPNFIDVIKATDNALPFAKPELRTLLAEIAYEGPMEVFEDEVYHRYHEELIAGYFGSNKKPSEIIRDADPEYATTLRGETSEDKDFEQVAEEDIKQEIRNYLEYSYDNRSPNLGRRFTNMFSLSSEGSKLQDNTLLSRTKEKVVVERKPDSLGRWRSLTDFPIEIDGVTLTSVADFWKHPSIGSDWQREIDESLSAIENNKPVALIGPHGTGKTEQFATQLALQLEKQGLQVGLDTSSHAYRALGNPWESLIAAVDNPDPTKLDKFINERFNNYSVVDKDHPRIFIIDEAPTDNNEISRAMNALKKRSVIPVFLVPHGYSHAREGFAGWAIENGIQPVLADHKRISPQLATDVMNKFGVEKDLVDLVSEPEGRTLLHLRLFGYVLGEMFPNDRQAINLIRTRDDLRHWLEEDDTDGQKTRLEGLLLERTATAQELLVLAEKLGVTRKPRREVIEDIFHNSNDTYDKTLDPLAYD